MTAQLNADHRSEIARLLSPTWRKPYTDADSRVVSVMERGIDAGLVEVEVRDWLLAAGHDEALSERAGTSRYRPAADVVRALHGKGSAKSKYRTYEHLIADDAIWEMYWTTAMERALRSTSLPRRAALYEIAEIALLRLLTPFKDSPRSDAAARRRQGLMLLTTRILAQPDHITKSGAHTRNRVKLSMDWVAGTTGWSSDTAHRCYRGLNAAGVITYQAGSPLTLATYGFPSRNRSSVEREDLEDDGYRLSFKDRIVLAPHRMTLMAMIDDERDPLADLVRSAGHPAIAYSDAVDAVQLAVELADVAGRLPETLGIKSEAEGKARERTAAIRHNGETFPEMLDRIAANPARGAKLDKTGRQLAASEAAQMVTGRYAEMSAESSAMRIAFMEQGSVKEQASGYVRNLLAAAPSPKKPGSRLSRDGSEEMEALVYAWLSDLHNLVLGEPPLPDIAPLVPARLGGALTTCGFGERAAAAMAKFVIEAPAGTDPEEYLLDEEDEDDERPRRRA